MATIAEMVDTDVTITLPAPVLGTLFKNAIASASTDKILPVLASALVEMTDGTLRVVSTDDYTMLIQEYVTDQSTGSSFMIGLTELKAWSKILLAKNLAHTEASLNHSSGILTLTTVGANLTADASPGTFPNWSILVPSIDDYTSELGAFHGTFIARMGAVFGPNDEGKNANSTPWKCVSMAALKSAAVWKFTPQGDFSATFLQMPVKM